MHASDLVLPEGVLERIESHILAPTEHRDQLLQSGRHMARGLLLWGPPGTGKTHTVRYLTGRLRDATIIILSGGSLGMIAGFGSLARRLTPSVVVLEDVDLVAQERDYGPYGGGPVLFELMNQMSGLADDADVAFVLTTNRPDVLEPALAARPGRVDLAVELPLPDAAARRRLIELYSRGLDLAVDDMDAVVRRTDGVTASFIKELLRKATLAAASHGRTQVSDQDMRSALDELMHATSTLTRALLGMPADGSDTGGFAPYPAEPGIRVVSRGQTSRVWLQAFSDDEDG
jgi:ATP-dependent 26S proteasome regulatory subunit